MFKSIGFTISCVCILHSISAQDMVAGKVEFDPSPCITDAQRTKIIQMLQQNVAALQSSGQLANKFSNLPTLFDWPLKQATGFNDNGYYTITNYVDEDQTYPNHLLDYNCGNRTYDLASGYNHKGTDIALFPFPWDKMDNNAVEIIAGAAGTIIGKTDGNFDKNCALNNNTWNAIYIQQADGSVAWYGHMKSGSLTSKGVGQTVAKGEFLGRVGSSGSSTAPHLHFEVYTNNTYSQLVDPWAGSCNALNGLTSWWASQQSYHVPTINKVCTHNKGPVTYGCPDVEKTYFKNAFMPGDSIYFGSFFRDQENATTVNYVVYKPDNSIWKSWSYTFTVYYSSSYIYWKNALPSNAAAGTWKLTGTYNGKTATHNFTVGSVTAVRNNEIPKITCYPNPASEELHIENAIHAETLEMYNSLSKEIYSVNTGGQDVILPVNGLSNGLYFLLLRDKQRNIIGQASFIKN